MVEVIVWILVAIAVIAIDIVTSTFVFMWFSLGAFVAIILSLIGISVAWQIVAFLVMGVATVSIGYPWAKKKFKADVNHVPTMEQTYIGKEMIANEDMEEKSKIKVSGIYWTAYNKGKIIKKGERYTITGIEGNKLIVKLKED
ncbi:NfeD family protein [Clostridium sp.]|jgi:membrane protein implicated in regulation of membrane protease activity|uniref:NfeD family protein n=1 Tax=Clostridium sp. TaxID=1506 RepID=UPI0025BB97BB|nr:NfeD family protein [Clostridium sp.]MCI9069279.1 NfeD family protein [Clostridium sp.]MCI9302525.1 NfeD family protein [Clostridium sp.]